MMPLGAKVPPPPQGDVSLKQLKKRTNPRRKKDVSPHDVLLPRHYFNDKS